MTLRDLLTSENIFLSNKGIHALGKNIGSAYGHEILYRKEFQHLKKVEKIREGNYMVNDYPFEYKNRIVELIKKFVRKHPEFKKRKRIKKTRTSNVPRFFL